MVRTRTHQNKICADIVSQVPQSPDIIECGFLGFEAVDMELFQEIKGEGGCRLFNRGREKS